jgi:nicotinamide-nucleotide adenylyltransferase
LPNSFEYTSIMATNQLSSASQTAISACTSSLLPLKTYAEMIKEVQKSSRHMVIAYRTNTCWPFQDDKTPKKLTIHVLDASFNPPTKAHLALSQAQGRDHTSVSEHTQIANILLLSISNADKRLTTSDASYIQRLQMMELTANCLATSLPESGGVAVIIINEPLFVNKQKILSENLPSILQSSAEVDIVWQIGLDTLQRLFDTKYYESDGTKMKRNFATFLERPSRTTFGGKLLCARRQISGVEVKPLEISGVEPFLNSGRIEIIDIGEWESTLSSTSVRTKIKQNDVSWEDACEVGVRDYIKRYRLYHL